jgi:hypothetical protein
VKWSFATLLLGNLSPEYNGTAYSRRVAQPDRIETAKIPDNKRKIFTVFILFPLHYDMRFA